MTKEQSIALCVALGVEPFAPVGNVERWQAVIDATSPKQTTETATSSNTETK
jgi:hypothetical protein